ncbi:MAG: dihydroneopterin aldolase [candidate division Zixibacteria bacterium]|nr:dihydroneopterin aldolase [candidate division Zixibacteria bacterium]
MTDRDKTATVRLNRMSFFAYHGVSEAEKEIGGRYEVDCEYDIDTAKAARTDSLEDTTDYTEIYAMIENIITNNKFNLMEALANKLADSLIKSFNIERLKLKVRKMKPPIKGNTEYFEVEIERVK